MRYEHFATDVGAGEWPAAMDRLSAEGWEIIKQHELLVPAGPAGGLAVPGSQQKQLMALRIILFCRRPYREPEA